MPRPALVPLLPVLALGCAPNRIPDAEPLADIDLAAALGVDDPQPVGITVTPHGERVVLDASLGLYAVDLQGNTSLVRAAADYPAPNIPLRSAFTDVVALSSTRFALVALGDGYILDLEAETLTQHFCYEPGWDPSMESEQSTLGLAFDPELGNLYAQPQTISTIDGSVLSSEIGRFDAESGADLAWTALDSSILAGGIAAEGGNSLLLGEGAVVARVDAEVGGDPEPVLSLEASGVSEIAGLSIDGDRLLVLDAATDRLLVVERPR
jgi:hypothetical protein